MTVIEIRRTQSSDKIHNVNIDHMICARSGDSIKITNDRGFSMSVVVDKDPEWILSKGADPQIIVRGYSSPGADWDTYFGE